MVSLTAGILTVITLICNVKIVAVAMVTGSLMSLFTLKKAGCTLSRSVIKYWNMLCLFPT